MNGINKVIIVGTCVADPETRYSPSGSAITSLRLATNEKWTDKTSGEKKERAEYHRVKFFGRLAEIAAEYLKKGGQVYVEGKLRTDEYEKDGIKRYSTDIIADEMQMLGSKGERIPTPAEPPQHRGGNTPETFDDDDIPF